ncbi:DUF4350 domain-containing protein [Actinomyces capricornis]|uniref:DUF4350 domain-containing protein n=1 Tax=Actinomyces capricornis TaxID=2755559 RepID=A0ABM7U855_9ACTO|nr:DUF4350 domain-containing protein [Actinomyces capricornis]BDA63657.1 hypothetical protein MANAM107_04910 [Actinomyces capricornis]
MSGPSAVALPASRQAAPAGTGSQRPGAEAQADQVTGESWGARLRRWRPPALALLLLLAVTLATMWSRPMTSSIPLAIDNPKANGTMALAELLRHEGVRVSQATTVEDALTTARHGGTVAVISPSALSIDQRRALAESGGDIVVVGALYEDLSGLTRARTTGVSSPEALEADCEDPDARAAHSIGAAQGSVSLEQAPQAQGCFTVDGTHFSYITEPTVGGGTLRVISDPSILTNARLTQEGHAALGIRALGHHDTLMWLNASQVEEASADDDSASLLPPWLPALLLHLMIAALVLAVIQGRRLGAIIPESLPAVVRSTETTIARGRLYRRGGDRLRAATALRTGTAGRLSRALGLGAVASRDELLEVLTRATDLPRPVLDELLYGPAPANDQSLASLATDLDRLESKVLSYD